MNWPNTGQWAREKSPAPEGSSSQRMSRAVDKWRPGEGSTAEMLASVVSRTQPTTHEFCRHLESFFVHRRDIAGVYDANSVPVCSASPLRCVLCVCSRSALSLLSLCSHCALSQHYALCSVCAHTELSLCPVCVLSLCSDCALFQHYALCSLCALTVHSLCPVCALTVLSHCTVPVCSASPHYTLHQGELEALHLRSLPHHAAQLSQLSLPASSTVVSFTAGHLSQPFTIQPTNACCVHKHLKPSLEQSPKPV